MPPVNKAAEVRPVEKYRVLDGDHDQLNPDGTRTVYTKGQFVETTDDLCAMFPGKFERVTVFVQTIFANNPNEPEFSPETLEKTKPHVTPEPGEVPVPQPEEVSASKASMPIQKKTGK